MKINKIILILGMIFIFSNMVLAQNFNNIPGIEDAVNDFVTLKIPEGGTITYNNLVKYSLDPLIPVKAVYGQARGYKEIAELRRDYEIIGIDEEARAGEKKPVIIKTRGKKQTELCSKYYPTFYCISITKENAISVGCKTTKVCNGNYCCTSAANMYCCPNEIPSKGGVCEEPYEIVENNVCEISSEAGVALNVGEVCEESETGTCEPEAVTEKNAQGSAESTNLAVLSSNNLILDGKGLTDVVLTFSSADSRYTGWSFCPTKWISSSCSEPPSFIISNNPNQGTVIGSDSASYLSLIKPLAGKDYSNGIETLLYNLALLKAKEKDVSLKISGKQTTKVSFELKASMINVIVGSKRFNNIYTVKYKSSVGKTGGSNVLTGVERTSMNHVLETELKKLSAQNYKSSEAGQSTSETGGVCEESETGANSCEQPEGTATTENPAVQEPVKSQTQTRIVETSNDFILDGKGPTNVRLSFGSNLWKFCLTELSSNDCSNVPTSITKDYPNQDTVMGLDSATYLSLLQPLAEKDFDSGLNELLTGLAMLKVKNRKDVGLKILDQKKSTDISFNSQASKISIQVGSSQFKDVIIVKYSSSIGQGGSGSSVSSLGKGIAYGAAFNEIKKVAAFRYKP